MGKIKTVRIFQIHGSQQQTVVEVLVNVRLGSFLVVLS